MIQREIERSGIPTIGISIVRNLTEKIKPPRSIHLYWPYGHPLGEPFLVAQQAAVLGKAFDALYQITEPGTIVDVTFKWRREQYPRSPWLKRTKVIKDVSDSSLVSDGVGECYQSTHADHVERRRSCIQ